MLFLPASLAHGQAILQSVGDAIGADSVTSGLDGMDGGGLDGLLSPGDDGTLLDVGVIPADDLLGLGGADQEVFLLGAPEDDPLQGLGDDEDPYGLAAEICQDDDGDGVCNKEDYCEATPPGSIVMPSGCHLSREVPLELVGVFFDFNGYVLRPESYEILDRVVALLIQQGDVIVEVGGHTDSLGDEKHNLVLSTRRAKAVYDYLVRKGIHAERLGYRGYGSSRPVAPNTIGNDVDYPEGRARNRRVELRVTGDMATLHRK